MSDSSPFAHDPVPADDQSDVTESLETSTDRRLGEIDTMLTRIAHLAEELRADPDGHVRRSIEELRSVFATRGIVEPAVARVQASVSMLRTANSSGGRREFQRRAPGLDHLGEVIEQELVPDLRRLGFDL